MEEREFSVTSSGPMSQDETGEKDGNSLDEVEKSGMDYKFFATGLLGVFLAFVDDTFVFTTYGTIASHFGNGSMGPWLITAYNLGFAVTLPLYGRLCDICGYRYPIQAAYLIFSVGCAMSGFASSLGVAIAGRFLSGAGGSGMTDLLVVIINDSVHLRKATELRSYISIVMIIAVPVGAPVGGALTQGIGWRWAFIIQIPMGLVCLAMALWRLRSAKKSDSQDERDISPRPDINLLGILLLGLLVASLMTICQFSGELRSKLTIGLPIASSIFFASALLFGINERCWTNTPLVPLKLLKTNRVGLMYLAQFFLLFSYGGISSHITEFWMRTKNYGDAVASACILPVVFGNVVSAAICSKFVQKTGRYKNLLISGCVVAIASMALIASRWPHRPLYCDMILYAGMGLGVGDIFVCTFTALSISVPSQMTATAMTNYYLCQQLGLVVGVSVASAASRALFEKSLSEDIPPREDKSQLVGHVVNNLRSAFDLSDSMLSIIRDCYLQSFRVLPIISCGGLVVVLLIFLKLPGKNLDK